MIIFFYYFLAIATILVTEIDILGMVVPTITSLIIAYIFKYYTILESIAGISGAVCAHRLKDGNKWLILFNIVGYLTLRGLFGRSQETKLILTFALAWFTLILTQFKEK